MPIETAPRDGTSILGYCPVLGQRETKMGRYAPGTVGYEMWKQGRWPILWPTIESGWEYREPNSTCNWKPTHWMPLADPPVVKESLTPALPMDDDLDEPLGPACSRDNPECESCQ